MQWSNGWLTEGALATRFFRRLRASVLRKTYCAAATSGTAYDTPLHFALDAGAHQLPAGRRDVLPEREARRHGEPRKMRLGFEAECSTGLIRESRKQGGAQDGVELDPQSTRHGRINLPE